MFGKIKKFVCILKHYFMVNDFMLDKILYWVYYIWATSTLGRGAG